MLWSGEICDVHTTPCSCVLSLPCTIALVGIEKSGRNTPASGVTRARHDRNRTTVIVCALFPGQPKLFLFLFCLIAFDSSQCNQITV
jgi:hypothetical protein